MVLAFRPTIAEIEFISGFRKYFTCLGIENFNGGNIGTYFETETSRISKNCSSDRSRKPLKTMPECDAMFLFQLLSKLPNRVTGRRCQNIFLKRIPMCIIVENESWIFIESEEEILAPEIVRIGRLFS